MATKKRSAKKTAAKVKTKAKKPVGPRELWSVPDRIEKGKPRSWTSFETERDARAHAAKCEWSSGTPVPLAVLGPSYLAERGRQE